MPIRASPSLHDSLRRAVSADPEPRAPGRRPDRGLSRRGRTDWRWPTRRSTCRRSAPPRRWPRRCFRRAARGASSCRASRRSAPSSLTSRRRSSPPRATRLRAPRLPPAVGALTRRHALATLIRAWGQALRGAIRTVGADGRLIVDRRRAGAGRGDARAGLCARRRSCGADRRHDHRGRAVGEDRDAGARRL